MTRADQIATAAILRRLLDAVARGELEASTPRGRALLNYMAGAAAALEADQPAPKSRQVAEPPDVRDHRG